MRAASLPTVNSEFPPATFETWPKCRRIDSKTFSFGPQDIRWYLDSVKAGIVPAENVHFYIPLCERRSHTCNPLGKNPGDVWVIPNVKHNHIEKTAHPCQFPIELVERLVLSLTNEGGLVVDPYLGAGSAACAAVLHDRRAAGAEILPEYLVIARKRVEAAFERRLPRRPLDRPVYKPDPRTKVARKPSEAEYPILPLDAPMFSD